VVVEFVGNDASAQRVEQLKTDAKRAQKTAQIAQQQATMKEAQEKLGKVSSAMRVGVEKSRS
jgi:hypothetical protein